MINSFKDTPVHSTRSHFCILDSEGSQMCYSSTTMAPTPSAVAGAAAEKRLQDIYKQELKDYK